MTYTSSLAKVNPQLPNKRSARPMARQVILRPGERTAPRQLFYCGELLCSVLLTYHDRGRGIELTLQHYDEPPHMLYYSGTWHFVEGDADHHYPLHHE